MSPRPNEANGARHTTQGDLWNVRWGAELDRHETSLGTTIRDSPPTSRCRTLGLSKRNKYARRAGPPQCQMRSDRFRTESYFDQTRTPSHTPYQAGRRIFLAAAVAEDFEVERWDVSVLIPSRADSTSKGPKSICELFRAMPVQPNANALDHEILGEITGL